MKNDEDDLRERIAKLEARVADLEAILIESKAKPSAPLLPARTPDELERKAEQDRWMRIEWDCVRLLRTARERKANPFREVTLAAIGAWSAPPENPDDPDLILPGKQDDPKTIEFYRRLVKLLKGMIYRAPRELECLGLAELWRVGMTAKQFSELCTLNDCVWKYEAVVNVGIEVRQDGQAPDKAGQRKENERLKSKWNDSWITKHIRFDYDADKESYKILVPCVYYVGKPENVLREIRAKKKQLIGREFFEEPLEEKLFSEDRSSWGPEPIWEPPA